MSREECDLCDATFKNKTYLVKHLKVKHSQQASADASPDKQKSSRTVTLQQDDHEEWDKDPEIILEGDQRKEENEKG